ncbi:D-amino-acid dehydrogenase [Thermocatellispora tengchongensis]|uniref:D-amino-acid dehydrogenase n=1 Tax=Thermocatellispora tengchongensis TaxID=1073253 RepID=A0A840PB21_9ACTN|nr:FAD-dependent oxidoreductase [Thermocatellispora tengchongensis]MBB5135061.1 D-amino-acid dehydrogenase [Thermocatellispora tengchongensis]
MSSTRIVIIGGGITGAAAAYELGRRAAPEALEVTVVDRDAPGRATPAGAGIICPWVDHEDDDAWYRLTAAGARHYPELIAMLAEDGVRETGYARVGALVVADGASGLRDARTLLERRHEGAPEMGAVEEAAEPRELFPPLRPGLAALRIDGAARVDGRAVRDALLTAAARQGVTIRTGTAALTADPGTITIDGAPLRADAVIVAAGAWTGEVCAPLVPGLPVLPQRGQLVHAHLPGADTSGWPIVLPRVGPYLLGFPGSRVVFGATRELAGFDHRPTVGGVHEVLAEGLAVAPGLAGAAIGEIRAGLRPLAADGRPVLGRLAPGVVVATGLSAYGLTAGPYAGRLAAVLALDPGAGEPWPEFTPARFLSDIPSANASRPPSRP